MFVVKVLVPASDVDGEAKICNETVIEFSANEEYVEKCRRCDIV